jgi:adenylate cyclase
VLRRQVAAGGTVTVITDITEQKHAERELIDATRRTEEANKLITEKNRTLEALYSEIQDKNRQVEEQAAQIAEWNARLETRVTEQVAKIGQMSKLTRFLSPKVSDMIMSGDADDPLKTHRRDITVVFVDLRGFTGFTETAEPEEVMNVLREYHAELGRAIIEYDGTIEHFAGDGVMILFNAPLPVVDHELQAIRMALRMREFMVALTQSWKKHGYALGFGVGIAGGFATIGTIGFEGRLDYGAIGTVTNLAARLCGEAGDGQILISPRVFSKTESHIEVEPVGELTLQGFHRPVLASNVLRLCS